MLAEGVKHVKEVHGYTDGQFNDSKFLEETGEIIKKTLRNSVVSGHRSMYKYCHPKKEGRVNPTPLFLIPYLTLTSMCLALAFSALGSLISSKPFSKVAVVLSVSIGNGSDTDRE